MRGLLGEEVRVDGGIDDVAGVGRGFEVGGRGAVGAADRVVVV